MAHVVQFPASKHGGKFYFDIATPVGISTSTWKVSGSSFDIMLVQFLLNYSGTRDYGYGIPLAIDGVFGRETDRHLLRFILATAGWAGYDPKVIEEGVVRPLRYAAGKITEYNVMWALNYGLHREESSAWVTSEAIIAEMPGVLRAHVASRQVRSGTRGAADLDEGSLLDAWGDRKKRR